MPPGRQRAQRALTRSWKRSDPVGYHARRKELTKEGMTTLLAGDENLLERLRMRAFSKVYVAKNPNIQAIWNLWVSRWDMFLEWRRFEYVFSASPTPWCTRLHASSQNYVPNQNDIFLFLQVFVEIRGKYGPDNPVAFQTMLSAVEIIKRRCGMTHGDAFKWESPFQVLIPRCRGCQSN